MRLWLHLLLFLIVVSPQVLSGQDSDRQRIRSLMEASRALIANNESDRGVALLIEANRLASHDLFLDGLYDDPSDLTEDQIAFGKEQLRQMLRDRPKMAAYVTEQDTICKWAVRRFAGESTPNKVHWSNHPPQGSSAQHSIPTAKNPGEIRVAFALNDREMEFEELWSRVIFELHNVANASHFSALYKDALSNRVDRDEFVREMFRLEFHAAIMTRQFYLSTFSYRLRMEHLSTNLDLWFFTDEYMGDFQRCLSFYNNRSYYPWIPYGAYYDAHVLHRALRLFSLQSKSN